MARNGKIEAHRPIGAINFLKKNIQTLPIDGRIGRAVERDVVDFDIAKKACEKANIEGHIKAIDNAMAIVHMVTDQGLDRKMITRSLEVLKDNILAQNN